MRLCALQFCSGICNPTTRRSYSHHSIFHRLLLTHTIQIPPPTNLCLNHQPIQSLFDRWVSKFTTKHAQQQFLDSVFCGMIGKASLSGCCVAFGRLLAISTNNALTLLAFFADVSMCKIPFSSAYSWASLKSTLRRASRSALLPAWRKDNLGRCGVRIEKFYCETCTCN